MTEWGGSGKRKEEREIAVTVLRNAFMHADLYTRVCTLGHNTKCTYF